MTSKSKKTPSQARGFRTPLPLFSRGSFRILRPLYMAIFWEMPGHAQDRTRHFGIPAPSVSKKKCQIPLFMFFGRKPGLTGFWVKIRGIGSSKKPKKTPSRQKSGSRGVPFFCPRSGPGPGKTRTQTRTWPDPGFPQKTPLGPDFAKKRLLDQISPKTAPRPGFPQKTPFGPEFGPP